ncbi:hypothetical protein Tco_1388868 [Tanacetum coccineum]
MTQTTSFHHYQFIEVDVLLGNQLMFKRNDLLSVCKEEKLMEAISCAGVDAIQEGFIHFAAMQKDYGISLKIEHYLGLREILEAVGNYARNNGDIELEDRAGEILISLDMSKVDPKKIPTPLPKKYTAISMLEGKDKVNEFMNSTLVLKKKKDLMSANKEQIYVPNIRYILHDIDQEAKELA